MRTRILRLTATTGATALLVGIGALATAGTASATTTAKTAAVTTHHHHECMWPGELLPVDHPPVPMCTHHYWHDDDGIDIGLNLDLDLDIL